jgi:type I restriction enzyme S subunit
MSFPRYPKYKPSSVAWLGEVPEHWQVVRLKSTCRFFGGGTPSRENAAYWNGGIPWVSPKDMKSEVISTTEESISSAGVKASAAVLLDAGHALLVVRSGILQHTIPIAINAVAVAVNQDIRAIRFNQERCDPEFFLRWVQGLNDRLLLEWSKQGATVESIEHALLANSPIVLPPLPEQRAIAAFLDRETAKIDALIAEQERLIELLKEKRQAVISHAVTKGLDPKAPMKPSGIEWLGDVPAHWEVKRLKTLIRSIEQGWSPQCEGAPVESDSEWGVLKAGCANGGTFRPRENKRLPTSLDPLPELGVRRGDLLVSRANTRELVGSAAVAPQDFPRLLICDKLYRLRFAPAVAEPHFFCCFLCSSAARSQIELGATGASASMLNIGQSVILELPVPTPSISEQRNIVAALESRCIKLDSLEREAESAITLLQERRSALISAAVTGQIDVRNVATGEHSTEAA